MEVSLFWLKFIAPNYKVDLQSVCHFPAETLYASTIENVFIPFKPLSEREWSKDQIPPATLNDILSTSLNIVCPACYKGVSSYAIQPASASRCISLFPCYWMFVSSGRDHTEVFQPAQSPVMLKKR